MMLKFLRSQLPSLFLVISISGSIILFYVLSNQKKSEFIYPIILTLFFYVIYLIVEGHRFYWKERILSLGKYNPLEKFKTSWKDHESLIKAINSIHNSYTQEQVSVIAKNQEFQRLIAQAVHNVKLPVSVVKLITEEHKETAVFEKIANEAEKISVQLNQVLSLLRLQEFEKDYAIEKVDLYDEVKGIINNQKDLFIYSRVYPEFLGEKEKYEVMTDKKWNRIILNQLISNAVKYSQLNGATKVVFKFERVGNKTLLQIIDQGIGIEEWDMKKLFQPFFTGENGRKTTNSSGIGLYISKTIAKSLNHEISIESVPRQGTTVTVAYLTKM